MPHIHPKIDFTVEVFIVYNNKVLLRKHDKYGIWLSVGGHIELDEDPNEAILREAKEEVGLDIVLDSSMRPNIYENSQEYKELIPPYFLNRNRISENHEHITMTYFATSDTDSIRELVEREKTNNCKWYSLDELEKTAELLPHVRYYAMSALKKLSS